jgi:hypothetical protein
MFYKLCTLALVAPLASALVLQIPENPTTGGQITIRWTNEPNDPETWSFELTNTIFNNAYAIANNVDPSASQLTLTLPAVPVGAGYTLEAVEIGDINNVYASTGSFSIGPATSSTDSGSSTVSSATSISVSRSSSGIVTSTTSNKPLSTAVTPTSTSPSTTTGTGTAATIIPSNAGALSSRLSLNTPASGIAAVFLSAVAGAAMIAL